MDKLIQGNNAKARAYYKEIVVISKQMQKEMNKKNPVIDHFINLGRQRLTYLSAYNAEAKKVNKLLRKIVGSPTLRRGLI